MAQIQSLFFLRHLRAEATSHVLHFRRGELVRTGRGLSFWFYPMNAAIAEIPVDDRDLNYAFHGRTRDYQEVTVQGVLTYRVVDAERLAQRIDFAVDLARGTHVKQPLEQIAILLTGIAQKAGLEVMAELDVPDLLVRGYAVLGEALATALAPNPALEAVGIAVETVRIDELRPTPELERALQTPTREQLQQLADEATFRRRALAVEKERAIAENELQTKVELAKREEALILQEGQNERQKVEREAEARRLGIVARAEDERIEATAHAGRDRIAADAEAARRKVLALSAAEQAKLEAEVAAERERLEATVAAERRRQEASATAETERVRLEGLAEAEKVRAIGEAKALGEQLRLDAYRDLPPQAVLALAAQELAGQLRIDNLTITPDMLGGLLEKAARLGVAKLEAEAR